MIDKKKLETIITKINNRCNPYEYESFDDLLDEIEETSTGRATFFTEQEVEWVQSNPKIELNILKMCQKIWDYKLKTVNTDSATLSSILHSLDLVCNNKQFPPAKNIEFLASEKSVLIRETIEETLLMLDLSIIPYR